MRITHRVLYTSILFTKKMVKTFSQGWLRDAFCYGLSELLLSFHPNSIDSLPYSRIFFSLGCYFIEIGPSFFHAINFAEDLLHTREIRQRVSLRKLRCREGAGWRDEPRAGGGHSVSAQRETRFCFGPSQELIVSTKRKEASKIPPAPPEGRTPKLVRDWRAFTLTREKLEGPQTKTETIPKVISNKQQAFCTWF